MGSRTGIQMAGLFLLLIAVLIHQLGNPLHALFQSKNEQYWQGDHLPEMALAGWTAERVKFEDWVYKYLPAKTLTGLRYREPGHPESYMEFTAVHSKVQDYLHDTRLCDYGQGVDQVALHQLEIPGTDLKAQLSRLTLLESGQVYYQLSWYQWGQHEGRPTFWSWYPVALSWGWLNDQPPQWHFFNLVYVVAPGQTLSPKQAELKLGEFAALVERSVTAAR